VSGGDGNGDGKDGGDVADSADDAEWPVELRGVTETVVTTLGPNGRWNAAALGVHEGGPVTARTWGDTRTRRNFHREGAGYVQFTRDPVLFVEAALSIHEVDEPVLDRADAWVEVEVVHLDSGEEHGTQWEDWALNPVETRIRRRRVPTIDRGFAAVVEATVAASRLGVDGYDEVALRRRLDYFADVADRCGGEREREAMARVAALLPWEPSRNESF